MSEQEPSAAAVEASREFEYCDEEMDKRLALAFDAYAAARVAETVAAERARISGEIFSRRLILEDDLQYVPLWVALSIVEGEQREGEA